MLLIVGAVMYMFTTARGGGGPQPDGDVFDDGRRNVERGVSKDEVNRQLREADEYRRRREEAAGSTKQTRSGKMPVGQSRSNSDWSIEDVDGNGKNRSTNTAPASKKTTNKDGWSIEDVPTKKNLDSSTRLKNSDGSKIAPKEKSDWSVEDVDPKTKKTTEGDWSVEEVKKGS